MSLYHTTDTVFIKKLTKVVEANLANENFGVKELAEKARMSRSQIHRRLKSINNQSVSQFIREIRLNKAKEMLQDDLGTVAEIAYKVGFGSPTYFIKSFHDYFGYPPGEFIKYATENNADNSKFISEQNQSERKKSENYRRVKKTLLAVFGILIVVSTILFVYKNFIVPEPEKSIAVLPLKNLSNDPKIQHLADGVMEDIRTRLAHIGELEVKSQLSSEKFRDKKMTSTEIAKELGVSYLLEGSIIPDNEKISVNIQLISAKKDQHKWAKTFYKDLEGLHQFITELSKKIVDELHIVLTASETKQIEKLYTQNEEAYNLYLEGRFYWLLEGEINVRKSIELFNQALAKDSNYSLAYAGLADAYRRLEWHKFAPKNEAITKCRENALKASKLDENLAVVQTTLGSVAMNFDLDWNLAEKRFKRALEINPNHAEAHKEISKCYDIIGRQEEAREHINQAIILNPYSLNYHWQSYYYYFKQGDYINALKESEKIFHINKKHNAKSWRDFEIYLRIYLGQNKELEALNEFKKRYKFQERNTEILDSIFNSSGIDGILRIRIENAENKGNQDYLAHARSYALINENKKAIDCLEQAFENGYTELIRIKFEEDFIKLRTEPRFLALLEKLNLGEY